MTRKIIYTGLLLVTALFACKKDNSATIAERPVVIAYLLAGHPLSVKVYEQKGFSDTANYGALIGGLELAVSDGSQTIKLSESATGTYTYSDSSFLQTGKTYSLSFTYKNTPISASTVVPVTTAGYRTTTETLGITYADKTDKADTVAVTYRWNNPDSLYHVLVFKHTEVTPYNVPGAGRGAANFTIDVKKTEIYEAHYRLLNYVGVYNVILYTVNKEYTDMLTTNTNTNSQQLSNPPGNITNGYGIFTGIQADTIKLTIN
jgi:hypothetical protein